MRVRECHGVNGVIFSLYDKFDTIAAICGHLMRLMTTTELNQLKTADTAKRNLSDRTGSYSFVEIINSTIILRAHLPGNKLHYTRSRSPSRSPSRADRLTENLLQQYVSFTT